MPERMNIPFCIPKFTGNDIQDILNEIGRSLSSGMLTQGPKVKEFEEGWAKLIGTKHAIAVNSCTAALHIALKCIGVGPGDEVIVPSDTFASTANAAIYCGARPVFAEIDPRTFNLDPNSFEDRINDRTKAVIPVHLAGQPCEMDRIMEIAGEHELPVIEDCAHAHGSSYHGKNCGDFGIMGCFSFYPTKVMASAEGGMITTDDDGIAERAKKIRNLGRGGLGPLEITEIGYNYRMNELQAILCLNQLRNLKTIQMERQRISDRYTKLLEGVKGIDTPQEIDGSRSSHYAYIIKTVGNRDLLRERLSQKGVGTSIMYHPVHLQPIYREIFGYTEGALPITERTTKSVLSLPIYPGLSDDDIAYVVSSLEKELDHQVKESMIDAIVNQ